MTLIEYVQCFTLVMQFVIVVLVGSSLWNARNAAKSNKRTTDLITQYRRELEWLTARIEALEGRTNGVKQRT